MKTKQIAQAAGLLLIALTLSACSPSIRAVPNTQTLTPDAENPARATVPSETSLPNPTQSVTPAPCEDPFEGAQIRFRPEYWETTDFCLHSIDYSEILSGGPPPDGIPAIDRPAFETVTDAGGWLGSTWPVLVFENNGDARAYPLAILIWHEIVNDEVGGLPISVTFCPLCNASIVFDRTLADGTVLDFGTSGNLRNSDLVMYDRQTRSWWQQFSGEAIVGAYTGAQLQFMPSQIIAWSTFAEAYPDGKVLSRNTGHVRSYGRNPYVGYDDINTNPFLFEGIVDGRLPATARVVAVEINKTWVAYPFAELESVGVVNDRIGDVDIAVFWLGGTTSALDTSSFEGAREIGSTGVFSSVHNGKRLTFEPAGDGFRDLETGSTWNIIGKAVEGPLAGSRLERIVSAEHFWFAWAAFRPETIVWQP